jgi:hypothetical protein
MTTEETPAAPPIVHVLVASLASYWKLEEALGERITFGVGPDNQEAIVLPIEGGGRVIVIPAVPDLSLRGELGDRLSVIPRRP